MFLRAFALFSLSAFTTLAVGIPQALSPRADFVPSDNPCVALGTCPSSPNGHQVVPWAAMGDSWASGVAYGDRAYRNDPTCLRIKDAYSVQLSEDKSWAPGVQDFKFVACSGARIAHALGQAIAMGTADDGKTKVKRKFATMTLGGNDAGFFGVAVDCFYQQSPSPHAYGPPYPDENSACKIALRDVRKRIEDARSHVEGAELNPYGAVEAIFNELRDGQKDPSFELYVTGYAHFFNVDDSSTFCNTQSFGVLPWIHKPLLSLELRREINELTSNLNHLLEQVVVERNDPNHVHFVDISSNFNGHRWCEPDQTKSDDLFNYDGSKAWFFNFQLPKDLPWPCLHQVSTSNLPLFSFDQTQDEVVGLGLIPDCLLHYRDYGEFQRPFHPIQQGHEGIKRHLMDAFGNKYK